MGQDGAQNETQSIAVLVGRKSARVRVGDCVSFLREDCHGPHKDHFLILASFVLLCDLTNHRGSAAAAGHGNFFGEQYTMVMKDRTADLFESVGLNLVARPFARHQSTSAPEVAACAEEIFGECLAVRWKHACQGTVYLPNPSIFLLLFHGVTGTDVDIITWDFAMTDGRWYWRLEFFAHRVNRLPNHPALLVLNAGAEQEREQLVRYTTGQGLTSLRQDEKYVMNRKLAFPDSRYATEEQLEQMPDRVRNFRCGYAIETGGLCTEEKFTQNTTCDERAGRTRWHHGWYVHAKIWFHLG